MRTGQNNSAGILSQSLNDRTSGDRDFQATMALDQYAKQEQAAKQEAAFQEQRYYELINEKADGLLGYDREQIQKRASKLQSDIREKIAMYGGDRRRFMANGGHSQLGKYSGDILNSREFTTYRNNKENLTRIMDAQQKGLGHLLLQKDIDSMEAYKNNKGGEITYGGIQSEIELPDARNYDIGTDVPITDIITHKENFMRIVGNYMLHNPDMPIPDINNPEDMVNLKAFAIKQGYGLKGSDRSKEDFARRMALQKSNQTTKDPGVDKRPIDAVTEMTKMYQMMPEGTTVESFYDVEGGTYENKNFFKDHPNQYIKPFISQNDWTVMARNFNLDEDTWYPDYGDEDTVFGKLLKDKFKIANANRIFEGMEIPIAESVLQTTIGEDGRFEYEPSSDDYRMDGVQMTGSNTLEPGVYKKKYKAVGITTGTVTKNNKGKSQLLMTVHDDNGDLDKSSTKNFVDDLKGNTARPAILMAFQDEESGNTFYREVDIKNPLTQSVIKEKGGDSWLLNDEVEATQRQQDEVAVARRSINEQEKQFTRAAVLMDNVFESNPSFALESKDFAKAGSPEMNRSAMMKSFYSVIARFGDPSQYTNQFAFTALFSPEVVKENPDLAKVKSMLQTFDGRNEADIIDYWLKAVNKGEEENPRAIAGNTKLAEEWKYMLNKYNELK